jgi:GNAT superfamily N-acetyltransferase
MVQRSRGDLSLEARWLEGSDIIEAAEIVSAAFLSSPVFAGIDEERYVAERVAESMRRGRVAAIFDARQMVGAGVLFSPSPASACDAFRKWPQLGLVGVRPDFLGRGIGKRLVTEIEAQARREGSKEIALSVTQRGANLIAMYERLGYVKISEFQWPGAADPSFIMTKRLS